MQYFKTYRKQEKIEKFAEGQHSHKRWYLVFDY